MTSSMPMSTSMVATTVSVAAAAATSSSMTSGMDMGGGSGEGPTCKISMLWNWYTIDACFLASSWHVSSHGVFAVSCIGVVLLVVALEFFRRVGKVYDQHLITQSRRQASHQASESDTEDGPRTTSPTYQTFRYTPRQQLIRSVIHMTTFAVAYFIMLLAMYFNGYIIISIFIGALLGKFLCDWETVKIPLSNTAGRRAEETQELAKGEQELTYCCG